MHENQSPIPGWNIDSSGLVATTRWHYSWPIAYAFGVVWNLGLPRLSLSTKTTPLYVVLIGELAALFFATLALRAFFARTTIRFSAKELTVKNPMAPWQHYRIDLAEIKGFQVIQHEAQGHTDVGVVLLSGVVQPLPIDWQPLTLSWNHSRKRIYVAPLSNAVWMVVALTDMLAKARLLGHDTYRS